MALTTWLEREEAIAHLTDAGAAEPGDALDTTPQSEAADKAAKTRGSRA